MSEMDALRRNPIARAMEAGGLMLPINPDGARTDAPGGSAVNLYISGANLVLQIYHPTAAAWKSVTLS